MVVRGDVDVQLVRGEDETLYVDVGITESEPESVRAALEDGFGLHGIPALLEVSVAGNTYSLGALAEKVVGNYLRKSGLLDFGAEGSLSRNEERLTLHRFEIDLSVGTADLDAAVRQLACGDLRLAQALADREGSGVRTLVSLARQLNARRRYLGAHISSLAFFKDVAESGGRVYLATPEGVQELVFTRLKESSGKFFRRWGFERLLVTSQTWKGGDYERATANLRLAVSEADRFTDRDQILDHVDALLRPVLPFDDLAGTLTPAFEDLLRQVEDECGECRTDPECDHWEWKECVEDTAAAIGAEAWREETWAAGEVLLDDLLDGAYEPASAGAEDIARALMALKLDLSAFLEAGTFSDVAGKTAMLTDVRVSMEGLDHVFRTTDGMAFEARVRELLTLFLYRRFKDADVTRRKLEGDLDDEAERIAGVRAIYEAGRAEYLALDDAAGVRLAGRPVGNGAFVLSAVGAESTEATIRSLAERKGPLAGLPADARHAAVLRAGAGPPRPALRYALRAAGALDGAPLGRLPHPGQPPPGRQPRAVGGRGGAFGRGAALGRLGPADHRPVGPGAHGLPHAEAAAPAGADRGGGLGPGGPGARPVLRQRHHARGRPPSGPALAGHRRVGGGAGGGAGAAGGGGGRALLVGCRGAVGRRPAGCRPARTGAAPWPGA